MALSEQEAAARYEEATAAYGAALERLARAYEPDPELRRDLMQEIHIALWRSLTSFDGRCSLRTWVYRVAHNTATSQVFRRRPRTPALISLDELAMMPAQDYGAADGIDDEADRQRALGRMFTLIQTLAPLDRQVILLYLEDLDAAAIGEVTGLSPGNVATKIHRIKRFLAERFFDRSAKPSRSVGCADASETLNQRFHEGARHGR